MPLNSVSSEDDGEEMILTFVYEHKVSHHAPGGTGERRRSSTQSSSAVVDDSHDKAGPQGIKRNEIGSDVLVYFAFCYPRSYE